MWKEIMQLMPRFVKIFLCSVLFLVILEDPFMGDPLLATTIRFCIGVLLIGPEYVFSCYRNLLFQVENGIYYLLYSFV